MGLNDNQILITISENKKELTIETGSLGSITFDSCPNKIIENIGNAIKAYDERTGLSSFIPEWTPDGCGYEKSGNCLDCN